MALTVADKAIIFNTLVEAIQTCSPPMVVTKNTSEVFELIGNKPVPYGYKKEIIAGMYFSSVVARKDMVSFYVFPLYGQEDLFKDIAPTAMKCLKGKTCFNFKKTEQVNKKEITAILKQGVKIWKQLGYMK